MGALPATPVVLDSSVGWIVANWVGMDRFRV
jgi:hypothetical protein